MFVEYKYCCHDFKYLSNMGWGDVDGFGYGTGYGDGEGEGYGEAGGDGDGLGNVDYGERL